MLSILWSFAAFIVALGVLITVHEFGHFWVARRCGVKVERFSIGFGKALWRRSDRQGTEYVIALIPLGGYVKMLDERVESVPAELRHQAFNNKTVLQRASIIAAGPIANFIFAIFAYWVVFIHGVPGVRPVVGEILNGSVAAEAQITSGMELKAVDGIETPDWDAVRMALIGKIGDSDATLTVSQFGEEATQQKQLNLRDWQFEPDKQDPVVALGIRPRGPQIETTLAEVQANSPASNAGLQAGDRIVKVDGQPLSQWQAFAAQVRDNPGKNMALDIERNGEPVALTLTPEAKPGKEAEGFAGVIPRVIPLPDEYKTVRQYGPFAAIGEASVKTWQLMKLTVSMLGKLIIGDVKLNNLSGPISIAQGAGLSAEYGVIYYLMFLALISVNLGIINLFPLPVLDGGHLLFLAIEKIKGGPVSERVQDFSYRIGSILLVLLMGLALFNDFSRL
ncbi:MULTISPECIES: sigma E protease regulator RseP [Enterobacterales]|jgi:regulator of sigma E protease|uniref:Zinc metalloprotease n=1 Tax=Candidatus Pantoea symbiotica TaxID=1884370 RepID=A0A1I3Y0Y7_9GAMM|nr:MULTISPECIES: sigma E protease regulator RseP [Enterobacterales]MDY0927332.1 sigma E protease regulator RseP [Enterobacter sp. CFBP8995]MRT24092.1 sigma E protease regulator RseP [Enterobacteriaceae bacterium RIT697]MRT40772.1 sigma E protease regulator RseP [Enterobacteriaceae bacterium RIT702]KAJ9434158.1 sigma E protease regulator RseP [Pantoea sp. YR343]MBB3305677.1 regulator of sigma E protease [Enterobacter sp. Sphag1F]